MRKYFAVAVIVAVTGVGLPAVAATDAECQAMWKKADANKDGQLSDAEAQRYLAMMRVRERTLPADNRLDQAAFMNECKANVFVAQKLDSGAPLKGMNGFTPGQARDLAMAQGFGNATDFKKDDTGIWRGHATQENGKKVEIAVDYRGNVVAKSQ
jgi:hypothetical protein